MADLTEGKRDLHFNIPLVEFTFSHLMGRWGMAVLEAQKEGNPDKVISLCTTLWYGVRALDKVSIAMRGLANKGVVEESHGIHLSLVMMNEVRKTADFIEAVTGIHPMDKNTIFGKY